MELNIFEIFQFMVMFLLLDVQVLVLIGGNLFSLAPNFFWHDPNVFETLFISWHDKMF
jgi:hypothetical protein